MAIVGFNFIKITAERKQDAVKGQIDIKNNVAVTNVKETSLSLGSSSQKVVKIEFDFDVTYEPKVGSMKFTGDILYLGDADKIGEISKQWKKNKDLPKQVKVGVLNTILNRCNIQALLLSQQVNLPAPIQLPRVTVGQPSKKKA